MKDEDGYIMVLGRSDDIIIVSGHNLGTAEVNQHWSPMKQCRSCRNRVPDDLKGQAVKAFVILDKGMNQARTGFRTDVPRANDNRSDSHAFRNRVHGKLPKTRSGKIMRRVLKAKEMGVDPGDISTLEE